MRKGFTLIELLIVVAIIAILAAIAIPNFLQAQVRAKVSRVQSDMRSIATAIETYYVDRNVYPAATFTKNKSIASTLEGIADTGYSTFTFKGLTTNAAQPQAMTLTTPVAYLSSIPTDAFGKAKNSPFRYYACRANTSRNPDVAAATAPLARGTGWILVSFGPDLGPNASGTTPGDIRLDADAVTATASQNGMTSTVPTYWGTAEDGVVNGDTTDPKSVAEFAYDPTNGTTSPGDIFRSRQ